VKKDKTRSVYQINIRSSAIVWFFCWYFNYQYRHRYYRPANMEL